MPNLVFITQEILKRTVDNERVPMFDFSPAKVYGDLRVVVPFGTDLTSPDLPEVISRGLADFTENDYLLSVGDPAIVALVSVVASEVTGGRFNLLKWDRSKRSYSVIHIDILDFVK